MALSPSQQQTAIIPFDGDQTPMSSENCEESFGMDEQTSAADGGGELALLRALSNRQKEQIRELRLELERMKKSVGEGGGGGGGGANR